MTDDFIEKKAEKYAEMAKQVIASRGGPRTIYRKRTKRGISVEIVAQDDYPLCLIIGQRTVGSLSVDVGPVDLLELAELLKESGELVGP